MGGSQGLVICGSTSCHFADSLDIGVSAEFGNGRKNSEHILGPGGFIETHATKWVQYFNPEMYEFHCVTVQIVLLLIRIMYMQT